MEANVKKSQVKEAWGLFPPFHVMLRRVLPSFQLSMWLFCGDMVVVIISWLPWGSWCVVLLPLAGRVPAGTSPGAGCMEVTTRGGSNSQYLSPGCQLPGRLAIFVPEAFLPPSLFSLFLPVPSLSLLSPGFSFYLTLSPSFSSISISTSRLAPPCDQP